MFLQLFDRDSAQDPLISSLRLWRARLKKRSQLERVLRADSPPSAFRLLETLVQEDASDAMHGILNVDGDHVLTLVNADWIRFVSLTGRRPPLQVDTASTIRAIDLDESHGRVLTLLGGDRLRAFDARSGSQAGESIDIADDSAASQEFALRGDWVISVTTTNLHVRLATMRVYSLWTGELLHEFNVDCADKQFIDRIALSDDRSRLMLRAETGECSCFAMEFFATETAGGGGSGAGKATATYLGTIKFPADVTTLMEPAQWRVLACRKGEVTIQQLRSNGSGRFEQKEALNVVLEAPHANGHCGVGLHNSGRSLLVCSDELETDGRVAVVDLAARRVFYPVKCAETRVAEWASDWRFLVARIGAKMFVCDCAAALAESSA